MKLSLDCVGYGGYFTDGKSITVETALKRIVRSMKGLMVYSHTISLATKATVGGAVYGWDEVECGSAKAACPWAVFIRACKAIGYDGYLSHEQCSPIIVKGHKIAGRKEVDLRCVNAIHYFKRLLKKLKCYTGHKP